MKRLSEASGSVDQSTSSSDAVDKIVRPAILVHGGPDGTEMEFLSGDGPIKFDAARIKHVVDVHNKNLDALAAEYGGEEKIPMGAYQPILDSHESDSNDRIVGRLTGRLKYEVRDVPKVGKNVPCAIAEGVTFLGDQAVKKVIDGRIYHLSIGINETDDSLGETSTVITPAAPGAMLLKKHAWRTTIQSKGDKMSTLRLKRYQAHADKLAKLTAMSESLKGLSKNLVTTNETVKLAARKDTVIKRLHAAISAGKMTPAEYKELSKNTEGFSHLAKLDDATLKIAMTPFEARQERVIEPGQRGSTSSVEFGDMAKSLEKKQLKRLRSEIAGDWKKMTGKKLIEDEDKEHGEMSGPVDYKEETPKDEHVVPGQEGDLKAHLEEMGKHLEAGDMASVKQCHEKAMACMGEGKHLEIGDVKSEDAQKSLGEVQKQVDELNTQMSRFASMVSEMMDSEQKEGHELAKRMGSEEEGKPGEEEPAAK